MLQQAVWLVQAAVPQLVGSCLVLATRHGLELPQPVLDLPALADFVNVPIGQRFSELWLQRWCCPTEYRACQTQRTS